jgi:cysteinyl-tRNA synthetase
MKLYNTLSKRLEEISSINNDNSIGFYACGPTVYDYAHIGHVRRYIMDDVLIRTLRKSGLAVQHVMNITDVGHLVSDADTGDDKMEKAAREKQMTAKDIAEMYEADFWLKLAKSNVQRPNVVCRATEHIPEQIQQVKQLEERGFTYVIPEDGVYFDTSKDPHYGELANLQLEQLQEGARIGVVEGKRHPADFALWKFSPQDEKRQMEWDSPWGTGFPGWHIECSAMSMKYLGEQFEIHSGGIDHIPVHHTNEIAQAENATGKRPFVQIWVHHNFLRIEGKKMSKSLKNFLTLDDIEAKGYSPMAFRLLMLTAQYRDEMNFTWDSLQGAQKGYDKLKRRIDDLLSQSGCDSLSAVAEVENTELSPHLQQTLTQFVDYMEDDLKTPQAVALMWKLVRENDVSTLPILKEMLDYLGLDVTESK